MLLNVLICKTNTRLNLIFRLSIRHLTRIFNLICILIQIVFCYDNVSIRMGGKKMKNEILKKGLLENINIKRKEMIEFAQIVGYNGEKTIKCSQELDMYLNEYQLLFLKKTS